MGKGVSFHTLTLQEDRHVRRLVKNLGRGMPECVVREELVSQNIRVQGVTQLRTGRRNQDPAKERPHTPPKSLCRWREGLKCRKCDHSPKSAAFEFRWSRTWFQMTHCNTTAASALDTCSVTADTGHSTSRVGLPHFRWMLYPAGRGSVLWLRGKPQGELPGLY